MPRDVLIFDMDGVLAEVTDSYRESIVRTVRHFAGKTIDPNVIQDFKNQGGWNNDWLLSQRLCRDLGVEVEYDAVVDYFCAIFFGANGDGLILREKWIPRDGLMERLAARFQLAIFTGRLQAEAAPTLQRFVPQLNFSPIVAADDVAHPKPHPEGLEIIRAAYPGAALWYAGDTVDDARASRAARVPFIGIAAPDSPRREDLVRLLHSEGAIAVLDDVNSIEGALP
jgi:HAD superfamily hydrolase (TIGR01548 family)